MRRQRHNGRYGITNGRIWKQKEPAHGRVLLVAGIGFEPMTFGL
jgi:hypothetical protein